MRVRAVLEAIERAKRLKFQETDQLSTDLTVEHLLPSQWEEHWPLSDGERPTRDETVQALYANEENDSHVGQIVRRRRLLNTFGNLTILSKPLNSKISNGPWEAKRDALNDHSVLVMNREIIKLEQWREDQIEARGQALFEIALGIWPYPKVC